MGKKSWATLNQQQKVKVKGQSEFAIPLRVEFTLSDLREVILPKAFDLLQGKKLKLHFLGNIKMKAMGAKFNIPIDHHKKIGLDAGLLN